LQVHNPLFLSPSQFIPGFVPQQQCAVALFNFLVAFGGMTGLVAIVVVFSVTG